MENGSWNRVRAGKVPKRDRLPGGTLKGMPDAKPYDLTSHIIEYENGGLNDDETIELFQHLVDNGMAWTLQGSYGRMAIGLIRAGLVRDNNRNTVQPLSHR